MFKFLEGKEDKVLVLLKYGAFLTVAIYFIVLNIYSLNIPYWDDYVVTLQFFNDFFDSDTISGKLNALLAQWSEHRIVIGRIISLVQYQLSGVLHFKILHFLANTSLILIYLLLIKVSEGKLKQYLFLPVALLLFQLQYYVAEFWFVSSSSMFFVILFSLLTLHYLQKDIILPVYLLSAITVFSNGNGMLILGAVLLHFILVKKYRQFFMFLGFSGLLLVFYFTGYVPHEYDRLDTLYFLKDPVPTIIYFFTFLGGCFNILPFSGLLMGVLAVIVFLFLTLKKYYLRNSSLYYLSLIIIGSGFMAALGRSFWGVEQALESRYKIFSIVLWISLFISYAELFFVKITKVHYCFIVLFCFIFNAGSYYRSWHYMLNFLNAQELDFAEVKSGVQRKNLNEAHQIYIKSKNRHYY